MSAIARRLGATDGQVWSLGVGLAAALVLAVLGLPPVVHHTRTIIRPAAAAPKAVAQGVAAPTAPAAPAPALAPSSSPALQPAAAPPVATATPAAAPPFGTVVSVTHPSGGVAIDADGTAYATIPEGGIRVLDRDGNVVRRLGSPFPVASMTVAGDSLVVTDTKQLATIDLRTGRATPFATIPDVSPCVLTPGAAACEPDVQDHAPLIVGVAAGSGGVVYAADRDQHIVWRLAKGKDPVAWSSQVQYRVDQGPMAIAVGGNAVLITVADDLSAQSAEAAALYRIPVNENGSAASPVLLATLDRGGDPQGLAVAPDGRIFVAQDLSRAIAVFAADGTPITRISDGPAAFSLQIAVSAHDLVAETSEAVVRLAI